MSDALTYLMKVRPEAMKSYFAFLKAGGRHLDPKTRAIISVITKVDNQTEEGFRQYLPRALQAGVSPDEIIDALLTAFPSLGLTKIVWAIDVLLEMNIPEFNPENLGGEPAWHEVANEDILIDNQAVYIKAGERNLFLYKNGNQLHVYDSRCPHQVTDIPQLALAGDVLTCPRHHWKFDIRNGQCLEKGDRPLHRLDNKIENGKLWVYW